MKIQVEHYTKRLKGVTVLEDVNVELCGGHIYGLRGKNGSGKTMFMRAVSGLMNASEGRVLERNWEKTFHFHRLSAS